MSDNTGMARYGTFRAAFEKNKKKVFHSQNTCGICGRPVDMSLRFPNPMSPCIDHIVPLAKGGHPSDIDNMQLAHLCCNRQKSDKLYMTAPEHKAEVISNRVLPQSIDWALYRSN